MDEQERIDKIKEGLKKDIYTKVKEINVDPDSTHSSTKKLANILEGYSKKIDTIEAKTLDELEEELQVITQNEVEVEIKDEEGDLINRYNKHIHETVQNELTKDQIDDFEFHPEKYVQAEEKPQEVSEEENMTNEPFELEDEIPVKDEKVKKRSKSEQSRNEAIKKLQEGGYSPKEVVKIVLLVTVILVLIFLLLRMSS